MKLPISWLREWVEVGATPEEVADALTRRGFYVEGIEVHGRDYPGVVVARVLEVGRHPNADRLTLCKVEAGGAPLQVVCGAPNVTAGMIAPLATVGAVLPGGTTIKKSKIRGLESEGMLCSARELELSEDHEGIVDLAALTGGSGDLVPGAPLSSVLGPPEQILEVEVPFNRPDALGVVGLAREVKAAFNGRWTDHASARLANRWQGRSDFVLEIEDPEGCPRYIAQTIENVSVAPSPRAIAERLELMGMRPINLLVDLTNYVMLEYGQPMHAFDLAGLKGPAIRVRRAAEGERLVTLDGKERALNGEVLVIADRERVIALAGVMGGAETEVGPGTTAILLECACFQPQRVRRGARALGIASEASRRFERGVDPDVGPAAVARFLALLREHSSDAKLGPARDRSANEGKRRHLTLRSARFARLAGHSLTVPEMRRYLESFEFGVEAGDPMRVTVPPWRTDIAIEDDLVEEVLRAQGYDRIGEAPLETRGVFAVRTPREAGIERARAAFLARGLTEAWTTSLVSAPEAEAAARLLGEESASLVSLRNPMSREGEMLRPNPLPGLLRATAHNLRQGRAAVRLFELGKGFRARGNDLPEEVAMAAAVVVGPRYAHAHDEREPLTDFAAAKGLWEAWLEEMRVDSAGWRAYSAPGWKPGASAEVAGATSRIGWAGTLGQPLLEQWEIEVPARHEVHLFVALLDAVLGTARTRVTFSASGRFPPVRRDLAFFVPRSVTHRQIEEALVGAAGERLASLELFDVYSGPGTPEGMKSLAFALEFQHPERTLTESEVRAIQEKMVAAVTRTLDGRLRER